MLALSEETWLSGAGFLASQDDKWRDPFPLAGR